MFCCHSVGSIQQVQLHHPATQFKMLATDYPLTSNSIIKGKKFNVLQVLEACSDPMHPMIGSFCSESYAWHHPASATQTCFVIPRGSAGSCLGSSSSLQLSRVVEEHLLGNAREQPRRLSGAWQSLKQARLLSSVLCHK
jgi:hypothetical protein